MIIEGYAKASFGLIFSSLPSCERIRQENSLMNAFLVELT